MGRDRITVNYKNQVGITTNSYDGEVIKYHRQNGKIVKIELRPRAFISPIEIETKGEQPKHVAPNRLEITLRENV